jgi:hypothetical protein
MLQYAHLLAIIQRIMKARLPDPAESVRITTYSFRRVGTTVCGVLRTPSLDQVDLGGWAGVPDLAKGSAEGAALMRSWRQSMPHLYCDRRSANEELQKLAHRDMVRELVSFSHQVYGSGVPISWDQLEVAARYKHRSGSSMAEHVRTYVFERLTARRVNVVVQRAFGCMQELKKSFTLRPPVTGGRNPPTVEDGHAQEEEHSPEAIPTMAKKISKKRFLAAGETPAETVFFTTVRGNIIHIRAPGPSWIRLCELRTSRAARPALAEAHVIRFDGKDHARSQKRPFCLICISRSENPEDLSDLVTGDVEP